MPDKKKVTLLVDDELDIDLNYIAQNNKGELMEKKTVAHFPSYKLGTFTKGYKEQGRNEPCACGSGKKHKHCCLPKMEAPLRVKVVEASKQSEEAGR